ncbi:PREDICTED: WD repeat-containing protein 19 [Ceratosolen solmsi marchali]|uniref:WD repeat-containing protein 19 n=1 Tax=Ceratosolen solmsi marchali TaxID=326594 RepID=A0AAJ7DXE6_9HYME|nr:PREDICTED: WD repeat-containing protein 19 [Ceratosolen solmsi marchali]
MSFDKILYRLDQPHGPGTIHISWQPGNGNYLATTGCDSTVAIIDRQGELQERIQLSGLCTGFGWDSDGDVLAMVSSSSSNIILWDATTGKRSQVDTGVREGLTCMMWAKKNCLLAVGTLKGNLVIYNHINAKRIPILGKHRKRIICGVWSMEGLLALAGEDKILTVSTSDGDTRREIELHGEPSEIQFSEMKMDQRVGGENTVSLIISKTTLYLYNILDPDNPIELTFQKRYGPIVSYKWYGDGYILLGFETGYITAISTHIKEVGQELFQIKNHRDSLNDIAINKKTGKIVTCGDNNLKIHSLQNIEETEKVISVSGEVGISTVSWSMDGSMLTAVTHSGTVLIYLVQIPKLISVCGNRILVLASLTKVALYLYTLDKTKLPPQIINTIIEPSIIAIGPLHVAVALNNRALFWNLSTGQNNTSTMTHFEKDYLACVNSMYLNKLYASVLINDKLQIHAIKNDPVLINNGKDTKMFPDQSILSSKITCHALSADFLVYGDDIGNIVFFYLEEFKQASKYTHKNGIKQVYFDANGSQLCFIDNKLDIYVYDPINDIILQASNCPDSVEGVVWDQNLTERTIFAVYNNTVIATYIFMRYHIEGSRIIKISETKLPSNSIPVLMYSGEMTLCTSNTKLIQITLSSHEEIGNIVENKKLIEILNKQILCERFQQAYNTCQRLNDKNEWLKLAESTLKNLNLEMAIKVYRYIEDVSMVWSIQKLENINELTLLNGHVCTLLGKYDEAEKYFLRSSQPVEALYLRRDLMQWVQALNLAQNLKPEEIPFIAREYAQQLEFMGNYPKALLNYERGLTEMTTTLMHQNPNHRMQCLSGIARTSIKCGDCRKGVNIAMENDSPRYLKKECAEILETIKQFNEAALLYEKAEYFDKAVSLYIQLKNWYKVEQLLPQILSSKINIQYAKAKEAEGKYEEAAKAYETANDYDNIIRINLLHLNNPARSVEVVQQTKSIEGAKMVAQFFQKMNDYNSAIKFLILSNCHDEAFQLANQHSKMELYGEILANNIDDGNVRKEDFKSLAIYFESQKNYLLVGKYYFHAEEFYKALKYLLKSAQISANDNEALSIAIDTVALSKDEKLANQLIDFLLGSDGLPKDPKYLFRLYMARKQYREAAKTAIIIANEEQINGNYRNAHDILFSMYQELKRNKIKAPLEMQTNMRLLHSYILVRLHVKRNDHLKGARMLIRVANNISKFPSHVVPILTSTVIECHRAGLKSAAFDFAAMLMRPEYRSQIDPKYSKKIEMIVRKPLRIKEQDEDEPSTACPYCKNRLTETEINCDKCKNTIPFCIATGRHIVEDDFTACPQCDFPAIKSEFMRIIDTDETCPICSKHVDPNSVPQNLDIYPYLYFHSNQKNSHETFENY